MNFISFTDESYITAHRFRSICSFSFPLKSYKHLNTNLSDILALSGINEFKWEKVRNAKYRFCAQKIVDFIINNLHSHKIRIDVITWDTHDRRHNIPKRDDDANFCRMFFHLMKYSMKQRSKNSSWQLFPDERVGIDWSTVHDCLEHVGRWRDYIDSPLFGDFFTDQYYQINSFREVKSCTTPCCQVSDLFAGMTVFSKTHFEKYIAWLELSEPNLGLFPRENIYFSNSELARFEVIKHFDGLCKQNNLGVSLKKNKRFLTWNPQNPINFWTYTPQHNLDIAPSKSI